jgi:carboxymethylenebutenolidase
MIREMTKMPLSLSRRDIVKGMAAGLPLAAVLADPVLARAAAGTLEAVSITTDGGRPVNAALAMPATTPAPAVLLVHEWWGLNDQIKSVAADLARQGYIGLAIDLYDGKVADSPDVAGRLMQAVDPAAALDTAASWTRWLKANPKGDGKVGTVGWCFGGGWSLNASIAEPVDATVVYYGTVDRPAEQLAHLKGPVLGHFATRDHWITREMVDGFEKAMDAAGKAYTVYWYDADHAFANPSGGRYDAADAALAWERTLAFYRNNL